MYSDRYPLQKTQKVLSESNCSIILILFFHMSSLFVCVCVVSKEIF